MFKVETFISSNGDLSTIREYEEWLKENQKSNGFELHSVVSHGNYLVVTYKG